MRLPRDFCKRQIQNTTGAGVQYGFTQRSTVWYKAVHLVLKAVQRKVIVHFI